MNDKITIEGAEDLRILFDMAGEAARTPYNRGFVRAVADAFVRAGLAVKTEYRFWGNDGRGGFIPVQTYFPPGSGAALTKEAKDLMLPKPKRPAKPRMAAVSP